MMDARHLTQIPGGKWYGSYGTAPCPVCQPEQRRGQNALTLADGDKSLLAHCKKNGCDFSDILAAAGLAPGDYHAPDPATITRREAEARALAARKAAQAKRLWDEARPIAGTVAECYLRDARGILCPLPGTLRFHSQCRHGPTAKRYPALVVREGMETGLSLASGLLRTSAPIWPALSTSGLRGLHLPPEAGKLTIATDGDTTGREAGHALAERAHALGRAVSLLPAPDGRDWNDILTMKGGGA